VFKSCSEDQTMLCMASFLHLHVFMAAYKRSKKKAGSFSPSQPLKKDKTLAVCMIVRNEEKCLPLILSDIQGLADELIVVDTGSTDQTIAIARKMGAHVVSQAWTGDFSAARNRSVEEATSAWILWLDADDRIEAEDIKRLQSLKNSLQLNCVYGLQVVNQTADGFSPPFMQTRLFPNDPRLRFESRVHESITLSAKKNGFKTVHLPVRVIHTGYATPEQILTKMERNLHILEEELTENPNAFTLRFLYANTLVCFNRFEEAQHHYERIIATPGARDTQADVYHGALVAMADTQNRLNNYNEAEEWARRAVEDRPPSIQGWYQWGKALFSLNQREAALEKFYRALACKVVISSVQVDYSGLRISCLEAATYILSILNRHKEAEKILKEEIKKETSPRISELLIKLQTSSTPSDEDLLREGQELLARQEYIEASKIFIRIIESNPRNYEAFNGLGLINWYLRKYNDAYILFRKAVETGPENEDILLNVWDAAQMTGQCDNARIVLLEALHRNPGMTKIKGLLEE